MVIKTSKGAKWLLPQVRELVSRGCHVTVILPEGPGNLAADLLEAGAEVARLRWGFTFAPRWGTLAGLRELRREIRRARSRVVFYHLYASALAARIATVGIASRRVMMVAGPLYLESRVIRIFERVACHRDTRIIAGSDYTRDLYAELGFPASRLDSIPYGVDCAKFQPTDGSRQTTLQVPESTFVAIMVAFAYAPKSMVFPGVGIKGHELLLTAWDQFHARHPESLLVLVGGGFDEEAETYRRTLMAEHSVRNRDDIRWFDSVDDVRPYYACADVSVSPSLSENHGAALEASAMGVPCIVSEAGGLPETVTSTSGWCVPVGDVDAIVASLEEAWQERQTGALSARAEEARHRMVDVFDEQACSSRVADAVLGSA